EVILFFQFVEMIIYVRAMITDFDPNNVLTIRSRPQASRSLLPQRRFQFLGGKNPPPRNTGLKLLRPWRSHVILLIGQAPNLHTRAARRPARIRRPAEHPPP